MYGLAVGCALRVWDIVQLAMGWSGALSLGYTLGGGSANEFVWMCTLGSGSHGTGSLGTLVGVWGGTVYCSLVWFSIIFWTIIDFRVWSGAGNGGSAGVSYGDAQLEEASRRDVMYLSCVSNRAVGASIRAYVNVASPWRIRSSGVTIGKVMVWWRNPTVSDIWSALVMCVMIHCYQ